ncbi:MAG: hypothetical protein FWC16_08090 [Defluviitaleaceae bacterium]|nr:hypothetical protein [Defluviitaleaceae bacterium]MCL2274873.1 hypothetical protein [Defluviitaleaceae bacterium]
MTVNKMVELAKAIQRNITAHAPEVWHGFTCMPFILYSSDAQVAIGDNWPAHYRHEQDDVWVAEGNDPHLIGNTATLYYNKVVPIWDVRTWDESSISIPQAAACLSHEMFHVYQQKNMKISYANELLLPTYPHNTKSIAMLMEENKLLGKLIANHSTFKEVRDTMSLISLLRGLRKEVVGEEFFEYDCSLEGVEGSAAYVEITMRSILDNLPRAQSAESYLTMLTQNDKLLSNYRHRCYSAGLALCLAADILCPQWKAVWSQSGTTLFNWLERELSLDEPIKTAKTMLDTFEQDNARTIDTFKLMPLTPIEGNIGILRFDPMNLTCANGFCLHKHGRVFYNNEEHLLDEPFLTAYSGNIMNVTRMWVNAVHRG